MVDVWASSSCMPKESQPRKNAYDTYVPLLFAFKIKVKFDRVKKKKKLPHLILWGTKKNLPASSAFAKSGLRI